MTEARQRVPVIDGLPASRAAAAGVCSSEMPRVLIVDDAAAVRQLARAALELAGHRVAEAGDGEAALRAIVAAPPAVVVCDVSLPRMDGLALLRETRRLDATGGPPFVVVTGEPAHERAALDAGAAAVLLKPFTVSGLCATVARAISGEASPRQQPRG